MGFYFLLMNSFVLFILSFVIFFSSLSENLEFLVHNEESLLILCFVSFIFFCYNFLSVSIFDDFQSRALALENDLFNVVKVQFSSLKLLILDSLVITGLSSRLDLFKCLLLIRYNSDWGVLSSYRKSLVSSLFSEDLNLLLSFNNEDSSISQLLSYFILSPVLFDTFTCNAISNRNFTSFVKSSGFSNSFLFFSRSIVLKQYHLGL